MSSRLMVLLIALVAPALALAQGKPTRNGPRKLLAPQAEIGLARSGAPANVSAGSRVWVFDGRRYVVADSGTTSVNCYVGRPWAESLEPHCLDVEASATVLPMLQRRVELYAAGKKEPEVEAEIAAGIVGGKYRLPSRPAVTYMMSSAQNLITETGTPVGAWRAHLMIYQPFITSEAVGVVGEGGGALFVENPGKALAALIVPLPDFVAAPDSTKR